MKLADIEIGKTYEYLGGRRAVTPVRVLDKVRKTEVAPDGKVRRYWTFLVEYDAAAWSGEPLPEGQFKVWAKQIRGPWVPPVPQSAIDLAAAVQRVVDQAPELTDEQRDQLRMIFGSMRELP